MSDCEIENIILLFKGNFGRQVTFFFQFNIYMCNQDFRAIYSFDSAKEEIKKLYSNSNAPLLLNASMITNYYRYDSGAK